MTTSTVGPAAKIDLWRAALAMSKVSPGEQVVVVHGPSSNANYPEFAALAAEQLGATTFALAIPPTEASRTSPLGESPLAVEVLKQADFVVDLLGLTHSAALPEIKAAGTRILRVAEPWEVLARMLPTEEVRKQVKYAADQLERAKVLHATSEAGTDLRLPMGDYPVTAQYGIADTSGRWDHWPSGFVARWPDEGAASGRLVLSPGDAVFPLNYYIRSEVVFELEAGSITRISGDGYDAEFLRVYFDEFNDPDVFAAAHGGWGLHPAAKWSTLALDRTSSTTGMDGRSYAGGFMFSTGPNTAVGGDRHTPCHLDIVLRGCSVTVDSTTVTRRGELV